MARTREQIETESLTGTEFDSDTKVVAKAADAKTEPKAKSERKPRKSKYTEEVVKRAIALRKTKGFGYLRVARAIAEEFNMKVQPASLRAATLRYAKTDSLNTLAKKAPTAKPATAVASTSPSKRRSAKPKK